MSFQPGRQKTGGRKKGTPNKATDRAVAIMDKAGFEPVRRAIALYKATDNEGIKAQMINLLMKRKYPELKALEVTGDPEKPIYLVDAEARLRRIVELQAKLELPDPIIVVDAE